MRTITHALLLAALAAAPARLRAQASALTKADVQSLLAARDAARDAGDWARYGSFFTADATVVNSDGKRQAGRAQIERAARENFASGAYKGARIQAVVESVAGVAQDVAVVDVSFEISGIEGGGSRRGRTTAVLVKGSEGWKIAATRSMVPAPAGAVRSAQ